MDLKKILPLAVAFAPMASKFVSGKDASGFMDIAKKLLTKKDATGQPVGLRQRVSQSGFTIPEILHYSPAGASSTAQVRATQEQLRELFNVNNFSVKTGLDTLANTPLMEAIYRKNKIGSHEIYSKSTSTAAGAPTIGLGSEKLS